MSEPWPHEHYVEMARLHGGGRSMAEIAHALNERFETNYTRSAVQGKVGRTIQRAAARATKALPADRLERLRRVAAWDGAARNALTRYERSLAA